MTTPDEPTQFSADQIMTPPTSEPFIDTLLVDVLMGPLRGACIHLPNADAQQAITDRWARNHNEKPFDANAPLLPPLSDEELQTALDAANAYYSTINPPPDPEP